METENKLKRCGTNVFSVSNSHHKSLHRSWMFLHVISRNNNLVALSFTVISFLKTFQTHSLESFSFSIKHNRSSQEPASFANL